MKNMSLSKNFDADSESIVVVDVMSLKIIYTLLRAERVKIIGDQKEFLSDGYPDPGAKGKKIFLVLFRYYIVGVNIGRNKFHAKVAKPPGDHDLHKFGHTIGEILKIPLFIHFFPYCIH